MSLIKDFLTKIQEGWQATLDTASLVRHIAADARNLSDVHTCETQEDPEDPQ